MPRVFVGMSGGVDSCASAALLKDEGHDVTGVTFTAFREEGSKKCCSVEEITAARLVCDGLGIPHKVIDVQDVFRARIIPHFIESYKKGLTPNPCVLCNRFVKFGALLEYALAEGADQLATGHYARVVQDGGEYFIAPGLDAAKDQSYFVSYIEKDKLPHVRFPLGGMTKPEVRELVRARGLPISHDKGESQDICFVKDDYRDFLKSEGVCEEPGEFIYRGAAAGKHRGMAFYSFGQRRGLNVAVGERAFVRGFDAASNRIILGEKPFSREFTVTKPNIFTSRFANGTYMVKIRYQSPMLPAEVFIDGGGVAVRLDEPYELIAPGQFAVFYRNGLVYASGPIESARLLA